MNTAEFLELIKQIESSGGKNTQHRTIQSGIQAGDSAIGPYGLMPNTIQEIVNRQRQKGPLEEQFSDVYNKDPEYIKDYFTQNPKVEEDIASKLVDKIGLENPEKSAYKWNMGHNLPDERVTDEELARSEYVRKFKDLMNKQNSVK